MVSEEVVVFDNLSGKIYLIVLANPANDDALNLANQRLDELRNQLVPLNKKYPIKELIASVNRYLDKLPDRRKATIEYTLIDGVNDELEHAEQLAQLMKQVPCKINLIPFNPFPNSGYKRPSNNRTYRFRDHLINAGHIVTIRSTRGDDIDAACGQLVGRVQDRTRRSAKYINAVQLDESEVQSEARH